MAALTDNERTARQLTLLLSNTTIARLERLRINASRRFTDKRRGEHLSGRGGTSIEFSDYRNYVAGDDVRFVDWNIFARLHRPYLKLYHQEEEMHVAVLIDASTSMQFGRKLGKAKQLAAAYGVMGLFGTERVSIVAFNSANTPPTALRPCSGRAGMGRLFPFIERLEGGGDLPLEHGVELFLKQHTGRGVIVILSDFLTLGDLTKAFNRLFSSGLEIYGVQILAESEIDPVVSGDTRLVDSETEQALDVTCNADLLALYQEYRVTHERSIASLCQQRSGRFVSVADTADTDWILFGLMLRKGWIR